ncbi:hypothetical protein H1R20_g11076, partial [Candolleomyces eurysporus]
MAKNWMDPQEIGRNSRIFAAFVLVLSGVAAWDVLRSLSFDISIIRGKRTWRWPMVLYFVCRICMLLHIFSMAVNLNAISEIPCQGVTWISKISDAIGTCGSSLILVLRTTAVWHRDIKVSAPLGVMFLGQVAVWVQTFRYSRSQWNPQRNVCAVISTAPQPLLVAVFAYTMAFDFIILLLCTYRLGTGQRGSSLGKLLLRDGIGYFTAAFTANLIQMIFAALQLNPVMNILCLPFALVVSVIAATTVFRNVFTAYDAFSKDHSTGPSSSSKGQRITEGLSGFSNRHNARLNVSQGYPSQHMSSNDIALGDYKHRDHHDSVSPIAVTKVVDIDVDGVPIGRQTRSQGDSDMDSVEKGHAL